MNDHPHYPPIPPHAAYIPPQMMASQQTIHQPPYPPHASHHHHNLPHGANPYASHPSHNTHSYPPQQGDYRHGQYQHATRPVIVSSTPTPSPYVHQYPPVMAPMPMPYFRPSHVHPPVQNPYYLQHETLHLPADAQSPLSMPPELPISNAASSPSRSAEAAEDGGGVRYETPITSASSVPASPMAVESTPYLPRFLPPLPWYSSPGTSFPRRRAKSQRKASTTPKSIPNGADTRTANPSLIQTDRTSMTFGFEQTSAQSTHSPGQPQQDHIRGNHEILSGADRRVSLNQPVASSVKPTSPTTTKQSSARGPKVLSKPNIAIPILPVVPAIPPTTHKAHLKTIDAPNAQAHAADPAESPAEDAAPRISVVTSEPSNKESFNVAISVSADPLPVGPPKSWADLVKTNTRKDSMGPSHTLQVNGHSSSSPGNEQQLRNLAEVLNNFTLPSQRDLHGHWVLPLLEPRGLVNTGNMCFMNSILQVLVFCGPFFVFLDRIRKNVTHNFKNKTPLIDAMVLFLQEFRQIQHKDSTSKPHTEAALAGDPFTPEYVYEAVRGLKRFSSMRRGHQQDAEEFLNFFLDVLHEECVAVMKSDLAANFEDRVEGFEKEISMEDDGTSGWLEVGHKQKAAITRNIGHISGASPVTKIFCGQLRSELRISGQRSSVTREPYQSLQLDIQSPQVNTIVDAIRHLGTPEVLQGGEFKSARGAASSATKQISIESLPPVLILHLKRFQYDNTGGTQKIWKSIGYPLELEIPNEALSPAGRSNLNKVQYKLVGVVYHHGKSATNGHYTVDVRRQDGWIRMDDTTVKRVSERDVLADNGHLPRDVKKKDEGDDHGWKEVSFAAKASNKLSPQNGASFRDDKVAYLLFYEMR